MTPAPAAPRALILASTSRYRQALLQRLRLPFEVVPPNTDETPQAGEDAAALALRLALAKARDVAARHPQAVVIGSDQVAAVEGRLLGKPGTHARAVEQLRALSGRRATFQTAVAVVCAERAHEASALATVAVTFRTLDDASIERYLMLDEPYDCAGSARSEALGAALLERIDSDDPTALIGLPLLRTAALLRALGIDPLRP